MRKTPATPDTCTATDARNQLGTPALPPAVQAWLIARGAVFARMGADGVVEFSRRPLGEALTDAALDLLPAGGVAGGVSVGASVSVSAHILSLK